jgi:CHAT domain-containing protein/tetratricopeptide (TPR) repeat protein
LPVEAVTPGQAGARAGIAVGDILLGIGSPADLRRIEAESAGPVALAIWRSGERLELPLAPGTWGIEARPQLAALQGTRYEEGRRLVAAGKLDEGLRLWLDTASKADDPAAVWLLARGAEALARAGRAGEGRALIDRGLVRTATLPAPERTALQVWLWEGWGESLWRANLHEEAIEAYGAALRLARRPDLWRAALLVRQGSFELTLSRFAEVEARGRSALTLYRRLAPGSLAETTALFLLAKVAQRTGDEERAAVLRGRSLRRARQLDPQGPLVAEILYEEGNVADRRGDLETAESRYQESLELYQRLGAGRSLGSLRMSLGVIAWRRGHLETAEREVRAALELFEREVPGSIYVAWALLNLGNLSHERGEWDRAEGFYRRSLRLREALTPQTMDHAAVLINLGALARDRGDPEAARAWYRQALPVAETAGDSLLIAYVLGNVGGLEAEAGNLDAAESLLGRCHALVSSIAPGGLDEAEAFTRLADLAVRRGRLDEAEVLQRRALSIRRRLAPDTVDEALSHHAMGLLLQRRGRLEEAAGSHRRSLAALEAQGLRLGGAAEAGSRFAALHGDLYKDAVDLLLRLGRPAEAFHVHERYRTRGLSTLLASRPLELDGALPPDLARRRMEAARKIGRTEEELAGLDATAPEAEVEALRGRLLDLRQELAALSREVRRRSPRLAELESPRPLDLDGVTGSLDPGTLLLAYSVGPRETVLFSLGNEDGQGLRVDRLPVGAEELRRRIESLRFLLQSPRAGQRSQGALAARSRDLYRTLIGPAEARVRTSRRLVVLPDGPLHALPFAVLVIDRPDGSIPYLGLSRPLHLAASATLYAGMRRQRREVPEPRLVAFGDPLAPASLGPLPSSRLEVEAIADLFSGGAYLGSEATEERAKDLDRNIDYLHFACHGFADDRAPLDSHLVLSPGRERGREDGILQGWEIFEEMRLGAELVTLSGCETGVSGGELGGEGLTGLTRAFQYAGSRTVLASLWSVSDSSTAALMTRFYHHLRSGLPKDEALRAAQRDMVRGEARLSSASPWTVLTRLVEPLWGGEGRRTEPAPPDLSHPYHWAAFQLTGDWR